MERESVELEKRKEKAIKFLKNYKSYIQYIILAIIIWVGYSIRIKNLHLLKDVTNGKYIPLALDPNVFLRYANYILENGSLMAVDTLRYYPIGFSSLQEFSFLSNSIVYFYKFLSFFSPSVTLEYTHVIYPPVAMAIGLIFFFLLVRKLLNPTIALISSAFLIVIPSFLYRTMAGFSDKEALGTLFMFMIFYYFISAWKDKSLKKSLIKGLVAGILTGFMGLVWGGVSFIFLTIGAFGLIELILHKFNKQKLYIYTAWIISSFSVLMIFFSSKFGIGNLTTSFTTSIALIAVVSGWVHHLIFEKKLLKIKVKLPKIITSLIITIILGIIFLIIKQGPSSILGYILNIFTGLTKQFATDRWVITVAESHQPYIQDWFSQFGKSYIWLMIVGSIVLFTELMKKIARKHTWKLTSIYSLFIMGFIFSRYSPSSMFNGTNSISLFVYIGSLILIILTLLYVYLKTYYKNKELFKEINTLNESLIFVLVWFIIMVIAARSAIRLLYIFTPITTIIFSYLVYKTVSWSKKIKGKWYKLGAIAIIVIITFSMFSGFYQTSSSQAQYTGPSYNQQWQVAGQWIRESTPQDSVFAHWWDYGYWVQTGGQRATLSDGGNARGAINHFIGRHVLTAQTNTEALELLKANEVTHLLMISDEIGKYPAYSSIGSDAEYDRYSWINTFTLDASNVRETRNGVSYLYRGGTPLDEDLIYQGNVYPRRGAAFGAFLIETQNVEEEGQQLGVNFMQPKGILVYNGQQIEIPINCIFFNNQELIFNNPEGIDACLRIIPTINNNEMNQMGALLYLSPRVKRTLFTRLYLFNQEDEYFKIGYNDEESLPLSIYNGRLIGPLKIWEVSYPTNLQIPEEYYRTEVLDPEVTIVKSEYS